MKTFPLLAFLLLTGAGCSATRTLPAENGQCFEEKKFEAAVMDNRYLTLEFLPDTMGRISSIRYRPTDTELLSPYKALILRGNPLFEPMRDNGCGIRELLWGVTMTGASIPVATESRTRESITFSSDYYGNTNFGLRRCVRLPPESLVIETSLEIRNNGITPASYSVWLNLLPAAPAVPVIPAAAKRSARGRGERWVPPYDTIFPGLQGEASVTPAQYWAGAVLAGRNLVWACEAPAAEFEPDGFFYSWQGNTQNGRICTFEPVLGSRKLPPGGMQRHRYRILVFPGLNGLRTILGDCGVDAVLEPSHAAVKISAASPQKIQKWELFLDGSARQVSLGEIQVPALDAGGIFEFRKQIPRNLPQGRYRLLLRSNGRSYELTGCRLIIK